MTASPESVCSRVVKSKRSSSVRNFAVSGQSQTQNRAATPTTTVKIPSMMNILTLLARTGHFGCRAHHLQPSYPPIPSILAIKLASSCLWSATDVHTRKGTYPVEGAANDASAEEDGVPLQELVSLVIRANQIRAPGDEASLADTLKEATDDQASIALGQALADNGQSCKRGVSPAAAAARAQTIGGCSCHSPQKQIMTLRDLGPVFLKTRLAGTPKMT